MLSVITDVEYAVLILVDPGFVTVVVELLVTTLLTVAIEAA